MRISIDQETNSCSSSRSNLKLKTAQSSNEPQPILDYLLRHRLPITVLSLHHLFRTEQASIRGEGESSLQSPGRNYQRIHKMIISSALQIMGSVHRSLERIASLSVPKSNYYSCRDVSGIFRIFVCLYQESYLRKNSYLRMSMYKLYYNAQD